MLNDTDTASMDTTSSLRHNRLGDSPQNSSQPKKIKKKGECICLEVIQDPSKTKRVMILFSMKASTTPGCIEVVQVFPSLCLPVYKIPLIHFTVHIVN